MKKLLLLLIALCAAFLLTACELDFNLPEDTQPTTPTSDQLYGPDGRPISPLSPTEENELPGSSHVHSYTSEILQEASCHLQGYMRYICTCGDFYTESIETLPHNFSEATCTKDSYCLTCGTWNRDKLGHDFSPTICSRCGADAYDNYGPDVTILFITPTPAKLGGEVTIRVRATDKSCVEDISVQLCSSAGNVAGGQLFLIEGDNKDGIYEGTFTLPTDTPAGNWRACVYLWDSLGNTGMSWGDPLEYFDVTGDITDNDGPAVEILLITPTPAKLGGEVTVRVKATDESGIKNLHVQLCGSAGNVAGGQLLLIEGDNKDGIYEGTYTLPTDTPAGNWRACVYLTDIYGNSGMSWGDPLEYFDVTP